MNYFITGATGFIGKRLVKKILARDKTTIYFLSRGDKNPKTTEKKLAALYAYWGCDERRAIPVTGDLTQANLGVGATEIKKLSGKISHFVHLAAIYDLKATAEEQQAGNIDGTRNAVNAANAMKAGKFHHVSSIAAAGLYEGVWREDMFDEAENMEHPYFKTKHDSEGIARRETQMPWRVYRPGLVVGDSQTGEMDKIDGPYYFFKLIQKMRKLLPPWMPTIGIEGGRINIVPVDFVVDAMDHLMHMEKGDNHAFHLTDPQPMRVGDVLNTFAKAAHAPRMEMRINAALLGFIPKGIKKGAMGFKPVRRIRDTMMKDLGLPDDIMQFVNYPTRFDSRETEKALKGTGIACPPLDEYAWRLWDYWERHLDPDLQIDRSLRGKVRGKTVLITGGSSGIGLAAANKIVAAGATVVIVARDAEKLALAQKEIEGYAKHGGKVFIYSADVGDEAACAKFVQTVIEKHGGVDILVNNAGRSIRRAIENSADRFHDFERTMHVNYFGALRVTMGFLPGMTKKRKGQVVNISSIGVLTNAPRFSAYVASKAALDAFTRCAASEYADTGVKFTTINMPLVRTPMIAPTAIYNNVPTLSPEEAADLIVEAIVYEPVRIATRLGIAGEVLHALLPRVAQIVMNTSFRMFADSDAAKGKDGKPSAPSPEQMAFQQMLKGVHF